MTLALALLFGIGLGLLVNLVGGGGSIVTVPVLVYLLGEDVHTATTTSLVIVGLTALAGAIPHARAGRVVLPTALLFGAAGISGAFAGTALNALVSGELLLLLFGILMLVTALRMAFIRAPGIVRADDVRPQRQRWLTVGIGLIVGVLTGFFGVGGGFLIVPALVLLLHFPMSRAVGTSLVIITINSLAGIIAHAGTATIDVRVALVITLGGLAGTMLGANAGRFVNDTQLARGFATLVAVMGVLLIARNGLMIA
jgi:uncharacterized protein